MPIKKNKSIITKRVHIDKPLAQLNASKGDKSLIIFFDESKKNYQKLTPQESNIGSFSQIVHDLCPTYHSFIVI